ncbi:MAG: hypothetical protein EON98_08610, partial [Chitinophagaceae bacterium]
MYVIPPASSSNTKPPFMRLLLLLLLFVSARTSAQNIVLKGKVVDDKGSPIRGTAVHQKGLRTVITANESGAFQLTVTKLPTTLVFTSVGFETKEHKVEEADSAKEIAIILSESRATLSEVVVTGYSSARRSAAYDLSTTSTAALSGKVSGVRVSSSPSFRYESKRMKVISTKKEGEAYKSADKLTTALSESKAKLLTAGELSDFKKWKLWNDYNADEFKQWSRHWGMTTKTRYCVQVQNEEHRALAGQAVYLLNSAKDTVWQTVTDNTGKAELWASFNDTANTKQNSYTLVCGQNIIWSPSTFENGVNRIVLKTG